MLYLLYLKYMKKYIPSKLQKNLRFLVDKIKDKSMDEE